MRPLAANSGGKPRVAFIIDSLSAGGTERHLLRLVDGLVRSGRWHVSVYCLYRAGAFVPAMEALGVEVVGSAAPLPWAPWPLISRFLDLYRYLRREQPAIAHCYLTASGVLGSMAARLARVPFVISTRRTVYLYAGRKRLAHQVAMRVTSALSDTIITVCEAARRQGIEDGTPPEKLSTVYNSILIPAERPARLGRFSGSPIIGTLGALHRRKGQIYLIRAVPLVLDRLPNARFVIAGEGRERAALEQCIADLGVGAYVELVGEMHDTASFLAELDLFVFPSTFEGIPNAVMEAMVAGLPVIATRVGGIPEIVCDGETGILIDPYSPDLLADAIIRLWRDPALREQYAIAGQNFMCERFGDVGREVAETEAVYQRLLHAAPSSRHLSQEDVAV